MGSKMDGKFASESVSPGSKKGDFVGDVCPGTKVKTGGVGDDIKQKSVSGTSNKFRDAGGYGSTTYKPGTSGGYPGLGGK
jgi:hypothetical protein